MRRRNGPSDDLTTRLARITGARGSVGPLAHLSDTEFQQVALDNRVARTTVGDDPALHRRIVDVAELRRADLLGDRPDRLAPRRSLSPGCHQNPPQPDQPPVRREHAINGDDDQTELPQWIWPSLRKSRRLSSSTQSRRAAPLRMRPEANKIGVLLSGPHELTRRLCQRRDRWPRPAGIRAERQGR